MLPRLEVLPPPIIQRARTADIGCGHNDGVHLAVILITLLCQTEQRWLALSVLAHRRCEYGLAATESNRAGYPMG